jgi:hypothetical protein
LLLLHRLAFLGCEDDATLRERLTPTRGDQSFVETLADSGFQAICCENFRRKFESFIRI